jgi:ATP-dependent protease ClpP protease subunit
MPLLIQVSCVISSPSDLKATMKENDLCNQKMIDILKDATGLPPAKIKAKLLPASDVYLTAQEVVDFGVADHLL